MTEKDIMEKIRERQRIAAPQSHVPPQPHQPEMLYIGCIDARLDPIRDIGIDQGKSVIYRNPAGIVHKPGLKGKPLNNEMAAQLLASGEIPNNVDIYAAIEFYLSLPPVKDENGKNKMMHIAVSGHSDCGALKACLHEAVTAEAKPYLWMYLQNSLGEVRARVAKQAEAEHWNEAKFLHGLEEESVRQSVKNLLSFPPVAEAVAKGELEVHGLVADTPSKRLSELNQKTWEFERMGKKQQASGMQR